MSSLLGLSRPLGLGSPGQLTHNAPGERSAARPFSAAGGETGISGSARAPSEARGTEGTRLPHPVPSAATSYLAFYRAISKQIITQ